MLSTAPVSLQSTWVPQGGWQAGRDASKQAGRQAHSEIIVVTLGRWGWALGLWYCCQFMMETSAELFKIKRVFFHSAVASMVFALETGQATGAAALRIDVAP